MTNNQLMPEQRPDKRGVVVTRWVKPNVHGSTQRNFAPPPSMGGSEPGKTEHTRSLFEKVLDSLVNFLLGPEDKESGADHDARNLLRQRLTELPERTVRNLSDAWERAKQWADNGLDSTEFGRFSERVREQVSNLLAEDHAKPEPAERTAERVDEYADRMRRAAERREEASQDEMTEEWPAPENDYGVPFPANVPTPQTEAEHRDPVVAEPEKEFSPLDDFFEETGGPREIGYNSNIDDLMDNGKTRRHH